MTHRFCLLMALLVTAGLAACSADTTTTPSGFSDGEMPLVDVKDDDTLTVIIGPEEVHSGEKPGSPTDVETTDDGTVIVPDVGDADFSIPDVAEDKSAPEVKPEIDTKPDKDVGPCMKNCSGKECGSDGCDGICGYCAYGYVCADGVCEASVCPKECTTTVDNDVVWKECGPDACGGYCGFCLEDGTSCSPNGMCYGEACDGDCGGKECGDDGCGHSCGNCQFGEICSEEGLCEPHPCGTVDYKGRCDDKYNLAECIELELTVTNCKSIKDHMCGWNQDTGKSECVPETDCDPQCTFNDGSAKECGDDGCWGSCGVCPTGWGCASGICKPAEGGECAWIDGVVGLCVGDVRWFCEQGILYGYDCVQNGFTKCDWDFGANFGAGGYNCIL